MLPGVKTLNLLQKRVFQLLILLLPTQLAFHFWPDWAFIFGIRVDYLSLAIYLTDIVLVILLTLFFLQKRKLKVKQLALIIVFAFMLINLNAATSPEPSLYKWVKIFVFFGFSYFITKTEEFNFNEWVAKPLRISLLAISIFGIFQFIFQSSLGGIFYYLGERSFTSGTPGIALSNIFGREYLRSYSIFSHPNSLAGFILVSLILLYFQSKRFTKPDVAIIGTSFAAFILTFSKSAILVAILVLVIKLFVKKDFLSRKIGYYFLVLVFSFSALIPLFAEQILGVGNTSRTIEKRLVLAKAAGEMISQKPIFGAGLNNFVVLLPTTSIQAEHAWDLQPVHNILLLFIAEAGIVGLIFLFFLSKKLFQTKDRYITYALIAIFLTGMVDHYWLTLQQNLLLVFLVAGLSFRSTKGIDKAVIN
jgi:O-antigen ligase